MKRLTMGGVGVMLAALLGGCSSSTNEELYERIAELEELRQDREQEYIERQQELREEEIDRLPDWVLEPPQADSTGMFGVGVSESKSLSHGLKAARLQAEFQLAKLYKQELSGSERAFEQGDSDGNVTTQTTFLIDKLVESVPIVGYDVVEQIVKPAQGKHSVYVLLKLPYDQFNKVLQQERAKTLDSKVQASFDDLERRLDKRRAQRLEEENMKFEQKQEAMKNRADILTQGSESPTDATSSKSNIDIEDVVPQIKYLKNGA
tara:strand:- start:936 stop:1724 length:789 start_codon:yes stop_codon:yes gene_type:complete